MKDKRTILQPGRWAFAALVGGNLALSLGALLVRFADSGPVATAFWRLALALPVLIWLAAREGGGRPTKRNMGIMVGAGLFFALDLAAWHIGILQTKIANATLFGNAASLLLVVWGIILARALPRGWQAAAIILAFAGSILLMGQSYELSPAFLIGDLLCLLAGALYTGYVLLMQRARDGVEPWMALSISASAGLPVLLVTSLALGERFMPVDWTPVVALALTSQIIGQGLLIWALPRFSPLVIGLTLLVQPAVAALAGWIGFGETLTLIDVIGVLMVAVALVLIRLPSRRPRPI